MTRLLKPGPEGNESMHATTQLCLRLANERIARDHRHAADSRLAEAARRRHRRSLRQRAAALMIRAGERLAAEPTLEPARSRQGRVGT